MKAAATVKPNSSTLPMSASTPTLSAADALRGGAAVKDRRGDGAPLEVTRYVYRAPGTRPVITAKKLVPLHPKPAVYVCAVAGEVEGAPPPAGAQVTAPVVEGAQGSSDTHVTAMEVGPSSWRARDSCSGAEAQETEAIRELKKARASIRTWCFALLCTCTANNIPRRAAGRPR